MLGLKCLMLVAMATISSAQPHTPERGVPPARRCPSTVVVKRSPPPGRTPLGARHPNAGGGVPPTESPVAKSPAAKRVRPDPVPPPFVDPVVDLLGNEMSPDTLRELAGQASRIRLGDRRPVFVLYATGAENCGAVDADTWFNVASRPGCPRARRVAYYTGRACRARLARARYFACTAGQPDPTDTQYRHRCCPDVVVSYGRLTYGGYCYAAREFDSCAAAVEAGNEALAVTHLARALGHEAAARRQSLHSDYYDHGPGHAYGVPHIAAAMGLLTQAQAEFDAAAIATDVGFARAAIARGQEFMRRAQDAARGREAARAPTPEV